MSRWQWNILHRESAWSVDATHDIGPYPNGILYTIVVRMQSTGTGVPVAYLFTNDHSAEPLVEWFHEFKDRNLNPVKVTIDASLPEDNAIQSVLGENVSVQYCTWHVRRAWSSQLKGRVTAASSQQEEDNDEENEEQEVDQQNDEDNSTAKAIRSQMNGQLEELMYEVDVEAFQQKLATFEATWSSQQPSFWNYFRRYWIQGEKYLRWAKCYQPAIYTNMETNNYVESWHNQLKTTYLHRRRNHRLDFLIYILVNVIEPDMKWKKHIRENNAGPMSPQERFYRSLEIKAMEHFQKNIPNAVEKVDDHTFMVRSFDDSSIENYMVSIIMCYA